MIFPRKHSRNAGKSEVKFRSIIVSSKGNLAIHINQTIINVNKTARIRAKPWMFRLPFEVS